METSDISTQKEIRVSANTELSLFQDFQGPITENYGAMCFRINSKTAAKQVEAVK
jgi:hypothetical protein